MSMLFWGEFMTRFTDQQCVTSDGQNLTFKTRPGLDLAAVAATPGLIEKAKESLQKTIQVLDGKTLSTDVKTLATRYFLTSKSGPSSGEITQIRLVLSRTLTGLSGDLTIKIGKLVGSNDKDVHGSVRQIAGSTAVKSYHNVVGEMGSNRFFWQKPKNYVMHAMRIEDETLLGPVGLVTIIHEATHKFAGTNDYSYFRRDGITPADKFTSKTKALENADSYAYFAVNVGAA
jgi:hypothetical protein